MSTEFAMHEGEQRKTQAPFTESSDESCDACQNEIGDSQAVRMRGQLFCIDCAVTVDRCSACHDFDCRCGDGDAY